jgi:superfamily II DNA or RNA helicase
MPSPNTDARLPEGGSTDPFLLDGDRLRELASIPIVRRGIAYFKEGRVSDLGWSEHRIWALVDGTRPGGYQVEITLDEDGELGVECDCPFDWEPVCKHAVATLQAYGARQPVSEVEARDAAGAAVEARMKRGRFEVELEHVGGDPWFGIWEARSVESAAAGRRPWRVQVRSVDEKLNHCDCPDFAVNRLGTCKHIEAVLHRLKKRGPRKFERLAREGPSSSIVHLEWEGRDAPYIRLRRAGDEPAGWLDEHFDEEGRLRKPLPEAFARFERAARGRDDVVVTPEVSAHLRRREAEAERRRRAEVLAARIRAAGGEIPGVAARLYPYQVDGVAFLASAGRGLLADDMGLGKTVQAIAAAQVLREHEGARRALVVCPASLKQQWAREVKKFTGIDGVVVQGRPSDRIALYRKGAPFTMINYELVLRDAERIQAELAPDLLILDEAQRIKNWRTKTAAAVKSLDTTFAFVLTGTPLENRLEDLYSLMQVVDARVLGPLWRYLLDFHVTDDRGRVLGYRNLSELRRRLGPVMLRRDKSLVRDQLPDRIDARLDVELDRRQRGYHDEAMDAAGRLAQIAKRRPLTPSEEKQLLSVLQTARMACNAAGLVDREAEGSPKLDELKELLEELCVEGGHKVVIFSQWERMTRMAEEVARTLGLGTIRLHGGVPTHRRGDLIDRFRDEASIQVFLSTDAGGVGLNLQSADVLINLDLPWNPAVLEQRIGRVHRLGQREPVQVVLLVASNSYEERIAGLIESKRELFRNVVDEGATEDVVGVSKKMVELAVDSLTEGDETGRPAAATGAAAGEAAGEEEAPEGEPGDGSALPEDASSEAPSGDGPPRVPDEESLAPFLSRLQDALGERIEQVLAQAGALVVVVDRVDGETEAAAADLDAGVPVAVVDRRSWAALVRLGPASPMGRGQVILDRASPSRPYGTRARRKLEAAEVLAGEGHGDEALRLAATSLLLAAADAAGVPAPPLERAAIWLHGELLPRGIVEAEQAAAINRGLALAAAEDVPLELVRRVLDDARHLIEALT